MQVGPILRALRSHQTTTALVTFQIAVSLAIIVNGIFITSRQIADIERPHGVDTPNIIAVSVRGFGKDFDAGSSLATDMAMLRELPGVRAATSINQIPLSGSGSSLGLRSAPEDAADTVTAGLFTIDEHGLTTLGTELVAGRNFYREEVEFPVAGTAPLDAPAAVIVTRQLAESLYPDGNALGKPLYWPNLKPSMIVGIVGHMMGSWPQWPGVHRSVFRPKVRNNGRYLIRAESGARDALIPVIERQLAKSNRQRLIRSVSPLEEIVAKTYEGDRAAVKVLSLVTVLLVGLIALVTAGLTSYLVAQRTKQIGIRRALGATRRDILAYFLLENWLMTTLGAGVGCLLTLSMSYWLQSQYSLDRLDVRYLYGAIAALWAVSFVAAFVPAYRATEVSPADATRTV